MAADTRSGSLLITEWDVPQCGPHDARSWLGATGAPGQLGAGMAAPGGVPGVLPRGLQESGGACGSQQAPLRCCAVTRMGSRLGVRGRRALCGWDGRDGGSQRGSGGGPSAGSGLPSVFQTALQGTAPPCPLCTHLRGWTLTESMLERSNPEQRVCARRSTEYASTPRSCACPKSLSSYSDSDKAGNRQGGPMNVKMTR